MLRVFLPPKNCCHIIRPSDGFIPNAKTNSPNDDACNEMFGKLFVMHTHVYGFLFWYFVSYRISYAVRCHFYGRLMLSSYFLVNFWLRLNFSTSSSVFIRLSVRTSFVGFERCFNDSYWNGLPTLLLHRILTYEWVNGWH